MSNIDSPTAKKPDYAFKGMRRFFPVHGNEMVRFVCMSFMFLCILFSYTIARTLKDTLMVNGANSGAEVLAFVKVWVVLPIATLWVVMYAKMSNVLSKKTLYYATALPFPIFFFLFGLIVYPLNEMLHPAHTTIAGIQGSLQDTPFAFLQFAVPIYGLWSFVLYYVMAELLGSVGIAILFWQFANEITRVDQSKRFYPLFGLIGNLGLVTAGLSLQAVMKCHHFEAGFTLLNGLIGIALSICVGLFYYLNQESMEPAAGDAPKKKKSKPKLSLKESFVFLIKSPYLGYIALMVLAYGISINLIEASWKNQVKVYVQGMHDDKSLQNAAMSAFYGEFFAATGVCAILITLFATGTRLVERSGWFMAALVTPVITLVTGLMFYSSILFEGPVSGLTALMGFTSVTPLYLSVFAGKWQNIMSKATKYCLFDSTKEMAYIPADEEIRSKGKAAVDIIGNRGGKSLGGWIQQVLYGITGQGMTGIMPYLAFLVIGTCLIWIWAARKLSVAYEALVRQRAAEDLKN